MTFFMQQTLDSFGNLGTDGCNILHTLLVKHYNDLLDIEGGAKAMRRIF